MIKLSSQPTLLSKWAPSVFVMFLVVGIDSLLFSSAKTLVLFVFPLQLLLLSHLLRTALEMLDEVFDLGVALLLRKRGQEESVPLSEVKGIRYVGGMSMKGGYHLITNYRIRLNRESAFAKSVTFSAKLEWRNNPEALLELKTRIKSTSMAGSSKQEV